MKHSIAVVKTNLSHWDLETQFSEAEAAGLIAGVDPNDPQAEPWRAKPALRLLRRASRKAVEHYKAIPGPSNDAGILRSVELTGLLEVRAALEEALNADETTGKRHWTDAAILTEEQHFTRIELARWLRANEIQSIYSFELEGESRDLHPRQEENYLRLIGMMLRLMTGKQSNGKPNCAYGTQEAIVRYISASADEHRIHGLSARTIQGYFSRANSLVPKSLDP